MNVVGRRWFRAAAFGFLVIAASYSLAKYLHVFGAAVTHSESEWQRRYWESVFKADDATQAEDWREAARSYAQITDLLPYDPVPRFNLALALAHVGLEKEVLRELRKSVEFGWTDIDGVLSDPVFNPLRGTTAFRNLFRRAKEIADESIVVYVPRRIRQETPLPLIIAFHGVGWNPHSYIQSWKQASDRLGAVVVAPRGNKRIGRKGDASSFRWITAEGHEERGNLLPLKDLLQRSIEQARQRADIDENRILLAGYSQGGSVALALLADAPGRFCGAVVEATSYWPRTLETWKRPHSENNVRVYFLIHELDRLRVTGEEAYRAFKDVGIDVRLKTILGADHELPLDNGVRLIEAVRFVLGIETAQPQTPNQGH